MAEVAGKILLTGATGFVVVPASSEGYAGGTPVTIHCYGEDGNG